MKALTLSATRRRKPLVILESLNLGAKSSTYHFRGVAKMVSRAISAVFGKSFSIAAGIALLCCVWWHNFTIADPVEAQAAVARDVLFAMPWGIVWAIRLTRSTLSEKGGEV